MIKRRGMKELFLNHAAALNPRRGGREKKMRQFFMKISEGKEKMTADSRQFA